MATDPADDQERELIERAKTDPEAFGILYERYVDQIYNYIYFHTGNREDAEDLTARTFHRALSKIGGYVHKGVPFSAWLYRIAHNLVANWHRDNSRRKVVALDAVADIRQPEAGPAQQAERKEQQEILLEAIHQLPRQYQQLLVLKFSEGMSNAAIGEIMGRSEGAIKSLYHRALISLRKLLVQYPDMVRQMEKE
ncbi:MAG: RNA polymerase sigma factor [Anaerolineae bacterium]